MNATMTRKEPGWITRLVLFVFLTLPGALLTAVCGVGLGAAIAYHGEAWEVCGLVALIMLGSLLLLYGTRTADRPLFLIVYLPMPIVASLGCFIEYAGNRIGFPMGMLGTVMPVIAYPLVSRYYRKLTRKAQILKASSPSTRSTINPPPSTINRPLSTIH